METDAAINNIIIDVSDWITLRKIMPSIQAMLDSTNKYDDMILHLKVDVKQDLIF